MKRAIATASLAALAASSGAAQAGAPVSGKDAFEARCSACHSESGWATRVLKRRLPGDQAVLAKRTGLTAAFVKIVVRHGTGSMPQIRTAELDDATLDAIAKYLEGPK
jgi:mono/diheme cytochrome c family protein